MSESLSAPDVHLISLRPELEGLIVPSKYYGIAAAGRSAIFIGDTDGEIARVLKQSETGAVVAQGDGKELADTVLRMAHNPATADEQGRRARVLFERESDRPAVLAARLWLSSISLPHRARASGQSNSRSNKTSVN